MIRVNIFRSLALQNSSLSCIYPYSLSFASRRQFSSSACYNMPDVPLETYKKKVTKDLDHFKKDRGSENYLLPHPIWTKEELESVTYTHRKPVEKIDWVAYYTVACMRSGFDFISGYTVKRWMGTFDEREVCRRCIFLETVAGVPGFSAAMIRHLQSLRKMERDHGWIHTLLEEAENERMHLMTFIQLQNPGPFMRTFVIATQWGFTAAFLLAYLVSPNFCHRFVGYLEEQAVKTYTEVLKDMDSGKLPMWSQLPAPPIAVNYWKLPEDAMMRDVILAIRADESNHRDVNHGLADMELNDKNPFPPGH